MLAVVIGWAFAAFIYFKVMFDVAIDDDLTLVAAFLMAVVFGGIVFAASGVYALRLLPHNWTPGRTRAEVSDLVRLTFLPFLGFGLGFVVACRIIIYGFAKDLERHIDDVFGYRGELEADLVKFLLIVIAPVAVHYAFCIYGTHRTAHEGEQDD